jgi:beta-aspartyl-peptidase (threonine type)
LDAVQAAITTLEDSPLFNAGKGAVFTSAGTVELDAALMDGRTLAAGSVAGVKHVKNPIVAARLVMERSGHVMLVGDGADAFAQSEGLVPVPQSYFYTERRRRALERAKEAERVKEKTHGTVGAVALDAHGDLAAGTSTGGVDNKRVGRVGDSPIIGAGTYANNESCAVSATGSGEFFIRSVVAYDIHALCRYKQLSLEEAAKEVVQVKLRRVGGDGGIIAIDRAGHIVLEFNSQGMFRGARDSRGRHEIAIY